MKKDGRRANDNRPGFNQKRPVLEPTSPGENVCGIVYHIFPDGQVPVAWNPNARMVINFILDPPRSHWIPARP